MPTVWGGAIGNVAMLQGSAFPTSNRRRAEHDRSLFSLQEANGHSEPLRRTG